MNWHGDETLGGWFPVAPPLDSFPAQDGSYLARLRLAMKELGDIANNTEKAALTSAIAEGREDAPYLTNHGVDHIGDVAVNARKLLDRLDPEASLYEKYCLLFAVYLHDAGIVFGREDHEKRCGDIMGSLGPLVAGKLIRERQVIVSIAAAHAGEIDGNKDKITTLDEKYIVADKVVHPRILAAVLRFADELSDGASRAGRFELEHDLVPKGSEVFHAYSRALEAVDLGEREVSLSFVISKEDALRHWGKGTAGVYLLDEIWLRAGKMHLERVYCMRFLRALGLRLDRIRVAVEIFERLAPGNVMSHVGAPLTYDFEESGYPDCPETRLYGMCVADSPQSGKALASQLKAKMVAE